MGERIFSDITQAIGHTPLISLARLTESAGIKAELFAKLEGQNPAGSAKDRVALYMLDTAEKQGKLKPGGTIVEPTSGNTGIGLCAVAAARGYKVIITMPETMSVERQKLMKAYGAELVLTEGAKGMAGAIAKAEEISAQTGAMLAGQFVNPANPDAHYRTTGPEIWRDAGGKVDAFVAGVGTGGTITGVGRYLKEKDPEVHLVAVEPADSPVLSGGQAGAHGLQGIGAGFVPDILDTQIYNEVITRTTQQAYEAARQLAQKEGILAGISSGAALSAALELAARPAFEGKRIVVLLPDSGERYLSTDLFEG